VTTPLWDLVFATRLPAESVRVPRRLAMPWLVDAHGEIWPVHAGDYELVGSARNDARTQQSDTEAAMDNRSPATGVNHPESISGNSRSSRQAERDRA
jgi:hypothetical protein